MTLEAVDPKQKVSAKIQNFASREIAAAQALIDSLNEWRDLRREWDANGYSAKIEDGDLLGDNQHVTAADLAAGFDSVDAIENALVGGHLTSLYKLIP